MSTRARKKIKEMVLKQAEQRVIEAAIAFTQAPEAPWFKTNLQIALYAAVGDLVSLRSEAQTEF